jgi:hypothetical protein
MVCWVKHKIGVSRLPVFYGEIVVVYAYRACLGKMRRERDIMNTDLLIAIVFFIIGLIPAYYFYKKGIRIKEPVYSIKSVNVISDYASTYENLTVSYKDEKVENFTVSKVLFFNRGAEPIHREDIATLNHLKIVAKSGNILDTMVVHVNNLSSDFKLDFDRANGCILLDFEYLNQHQGAVIEVVHTGLSSQDIDVIGDLKGVKSLKKLSQSSLTNFPPLNRSITIAILLFCLI